MSTASTCPALFIHRTQGLAPVADALSGATVYTDIVDASNARWICFLLQKGVGTTGTSTLTVQACDDVSASNTTAIVFKSRTMTTADTWGALTARATTGYATTAGSNHMEEVWVDANDVAATGYQFVRLKAAEVVDDPVLAGITVEFHGLRDSPNSASAIA